MGIFENKGSGSTIVIVGLLLASMWVGVFVIMPDENIVEGTNHSGSTSADETWTVAGNPHIITADFTVSSGDKLTIDPDVIVKFDSGFKIIVDGTLQANGTEINPINFTSNEPIKTIGDVDEIMFSSSSNNNFMKFCNISFASNGINSLSSSLHIENNTIFNCTTGIRIQGGYPLIINSTINDTGTGIIISGGSPNICNNNIHDITGNGIIITGDSTSPHIFSNNINNCTTGINITDCAANTRIDNNTIDNTTEFGIMINDGPPIIYNNTINHTDMAILVASGTADISYSHLSNYTGGIIGMGGTPVIHDNTITYNGSNSFSIAIVGGSAEVYNNMINGSMIGIMVQGASTTANIHDNDMSYCFGGALLNSSSKFRFNYNNFDSCNISIWTWNEAIVENCSFTNSTIVHFSLNAPIIHEVYSRNCWYNDSVHVESGNKLYKQWSVNVSVNDSDSNPLNNVNIDVDENNPIINIPGSPFFTDTGGWAGWIWCTEKEYTPGSQITSKNDHSFIVFKQDYDVDIKSQAITQPTDILFTISDNKPPDSKLNTPVKYWYNSNTVNFTYNATDNYLTQNISFYYGFSADGQSFTDIADFIHFSEIDLGNQSGQLSGNFTFDFPAGEGYYRLYSIASDKLDNREMPPASIDIEIGYDLTGPTFKTIVVTNITEDSAYGSCRVTVTINDTHSGISGTPQIRYKWDSATATWNGTGLQMTQLFRGPRNDVTYYYDIPAPPSNEWEDLAAKYIEWEVTCSDIIGNLGTENQLECIDYVNHAPSIQLIDPEADVWANGIIKIRTIAADDADLGDPVTEWGIKHVYAQYSIDSTDGTNGTWWNCTSAPVIEEPHNINWDSTLVIGSEPMVWIRAIAVDTGSLTSSWVSRRIKIDNEPPGSKIDYDKLWHNSNFTIDISADDSIGSGVANILYKLNNGTATNLTMAKPTIDHESINNTLEYWSVDMLGNAEAHQFQYNIMLDKTKPIISDVKITNITKSTSNTVNIVISTNVSDLLSGLKELPEFRFTFPDDTAIVEWEPMTKVNGDSRFEAKFKVPVGKSWADFEDEDITFQIKSIDLANNIQFVTATELVESTEPPSISHTPIDTAFIGEEIMINATVIDDVGVLEVILFYQSIDETQFSSISMVRSGSGDIYSAKIPPQSNVGNVYYYITARDELENISLPFQDPTTNAFIIIVLKDTDGDRFADIDDAFPNDASEWLDTDGDNIGDNIDTDSDADGYLDDWELFLGTDPKNQNDMPLDTDLDGKPDGDNGNTESWMDTDDDGDGFSDAEEQKAGTDPKDSTKHPDKKETSDQMMFMIMAIVVIIIIALILGILARKRSAKTEPGGESEEDIKAGDEEELVMTQPIPEGEEGLYEEELGDEEPVGGEPSEDEPVDEEPQEDEPVVDEKLEEYECPECGAKLTTDVTACPECGVEFEDDEGEVEEDDNEEFEEDAGIGDDDSGSKMDPDPGLSEE